MLKTAFFLLEKDIAEGKVIVNQDNQDYIQEQKLVRKIIAI